MIAEGLIVCRVPLLPVEVAFSFSALSSPVRSISTVGRCSGFAKGPSRSIRIGVVVDPLDQRRLSADGKDNLLCAEVPPVGSVVVARSPHKKVYQQDVQIETKSNSSTLRQGFRVSNTHLGKIHCWPRAKRISSAA
mmetsp:Transcript_11666/g.48517  ORF Transcript_11666/g.48517 Transcript_11666/m.48517 type:complete len:136 (+) Transcript_11666:829-1236(+)